ncbi:hypothetical protein [Oceanidesulfovibrio marinus]|uniref:Membrane domain of glycerophosphoryl diester phosphodiesterase n=1 Tax=Oceanidesulfovibrio marinus TaxID=370038 RepID=A0ABX6NBI1_9BACT|nr:hypothetical protein [Oceanidesulfovibrio marinus]QJT07433.1 hypothetical protein E8L03_00225 [Oceanidesulfovibrio marinus]
MQYRIGELRLGDLLDVGYNVFKDNYKPLLGLALMAFVPVLLVFGVGALFGGVPLISQADFFPQPGNPPPDPKFLMQNFHAMFATMAASSLVMSICALFAHGGIILAVARGYTGQPISAGVALRYSLSRWWPLIKTTIIFVLTILLVFGAIIGAFQLFSGLVGRHNHFFLMMPVFVVSVVAMALVFLRYVLSLTVVILEGVSGFAALKRSATLMKGAYGKAFLLLVLVSIASMIPSGLLNVLVMIPGVPFFLVAMGGGMFMQMIMMAFVTTVLTILYFSNRCKHENFDLVLLAEEAEEI